MYTRGMSEVSTIPQPHPALDPLIFAVGADVWNRLAPELVLGLNGLIDGTNTYCWAHHEIEAARFDRCGECFHGWDTADQIIDEDFAVAAELWPGQAVRAQSVAEIWVCPACSHDL
jgi:hypothetical protein